jgi:hypothetical protein
VDPSYKHAKPFIDTTYIKIQLTFSISWGLNYSLMAMEKRQQIFKSGSVINNFWLVKTCLVTIKLLNVFSAKGGYAPRPFAKPPHTLFNYGYVDPKPHLNRAHSHSAAIKPS